MPKELVLRLDWSISDELLVELFCEGSGLWVVYSTIDVGERAFRPDKIRETTVEAARLECPHGFEGERP